MEGWLYAEEFLYWLDLLDDYETIDVLFENQDDLPWEESMP